MSIVQLVINNGPLAGLIDTRIYPVVLPATPVLPAVTYQLVSEPEEATQDGAGMAQARYRFKVWTVSHAELNPIVAAIKVAFTGHNIAFPRGSLPDNSIEDYDVKTKRWWRVIDVLGWQPA